MNKMINLLSHGNNKDIFNHCNNDRSNFRLVKSTIKYEWPWMEFDGKNYSFVTIEWAKKLFLWPDRFYLTIQLYLFYFLNVNKVHVRYTYRYDH